MSEFWCESGDNTTPRSENFTHLLVPKVSENGSVEMVDTILETVNSPLDLLSFDDFTIEQCIRHGISYKALQISDDFRMGHDAEIDAFNARVESIKDKLFVEPKN